MKKFAIMFLFPLLLIACSNDTEENEIENLNEETTSASSVSDVDSDTENNDDENTEEVGSNQKDIDDYAWIVYPIENVAVNDMLEDSQNGTVVMIPEDADALELATIEEFTSGESRPEWSTYMTELYNVMKDDMSEEYNSVWRDAVNSVHDDPSAVPALVEEAREIRESEE